VEEEEETVLKSDFVLYPREVFIFFSKPPFCFAPNYRCCIVVVTHLSTDHYQQKVSALETKHDKATSKLSQHEKESEERAAAATAAEKKAQVEVVVALSSCVLTFFISVKAIRCQTLRINPSHLPTRTTRVLALLRRHSSSPFFILLLRLLSSFFSIFISKEDLVSKNNVFTSAVQSANEPEWLKESENSNQKRPSILLGGVDANRKASLYDPVKDYKALDKQRKAAAAEAEKVSRNQVGLCSTHFLPTAMAFCVIRVCICSGSQPHGWCYSSRVLSGLCSHE
jgi:hypothetical protein